MQQLQLKMLFALFLAARWSLEELSSAMHMSSSMLRRCLGYWLGQGVLKQESQDVYVVLEKNRGGQDLQGKHI
jgi:AraC-like DNA-binding protein